MKKVLLYAVSAAALLTCATSGAQAVTKEFCADYAQTAVDQFQEATKHDACQSYIKGNGLRWQPIYQNHYNGCKMFGRTASESEQEIRRQALADCAHD